MWLAANFNALSLLPLRTTEKFDKIQPKRFPVIFR
jgi:hypothetical protein